MTRRRMAAALAGLVLGACGTGGGTDVAVFQLHDPGSGPDLLTRLESGPSARWTYRVSNLKESYDSYYEGLAQVHGGATERYVTQLQVVYQQVTDEGVFYWGSSDGDLLEHPLVTVSLPLRLGRVWTTGGVDDPQHYRYQVVGADEVETPAGRFHAAHLRQLNTETGLAVERWYADGVGLVQRSGADQDGKVVTTTLLRYAHAGAQP